MQSRKAGRKEYRKKEKDGRNALPLPYQIFNRQGSSSISISDAFFLASFLPGFLFCIGIFSALLLCLFLLSR